MRQAHRTVVLYENGIEIDRGSGVRIAALFFDNKDPKQQADHSRMVAKLSLNHVVDIERDGNTYKIKPLAPTPNSKVVQYEKAKSLYRRCNKEAGRAAKERRKLKTGSAEWMEVQLNMLKAEAGAKIAKEWMQKYSDGDTTYNHKNN